MVPTIVGLVLSVFGMVPTMVAIAVAFNLAPHSWDKVLTTVGTTLIRYCLVATIVGPVLSWYGPNYGWHRTYEAYSMNEHDCKITIVIIILIIIVSFQDGSHMNQKKYYNKYK